MNESERWVETLLMHMLQRLAERGRHVEDVRTFEEGKVLTDNAGLTLRLRNGTEFQVTIVQSR